MFGPKNAALIFSIFLVAHFAVGAEFRPGEVIVKYRDGFFRTRAAANKLYDAIGVKNVRRYSGLMKGYEHLVLEQNVDVQNAIASLKKDRTVEYAQPNYILHVLPILKSDNRELNFNPTRACWIPGIPVPPGCDDGDSSQPSSSTTRPTLKDAPSDITPAVNDPDADKSYGLKKVSAVEAWKTWRGNKNFVVADIDTGIDYNHEDLAFNVWRNPHPDATNKDVVGFDFVHNDGLPFDDNEHGTHTAGTIGAVGGNGIGTSGVAQRISLMALKFITSQGDGTTADAIRAIDYAVQHGAKVLSNSWGGPGDSDNQALKDAIDRAKGQDVLFVAAAGNDGTDNDSAPSFPAAFDEDNIISVAATDQSDSLAYFSNYGKTTTHVAAPGVDVYSTLPGNKYGNLSGTSMACPHVAGAAALLWSRHPSWNYKQVKALLLKTVDPIGSLDGKVSTGGRINVLKALKAADEL